jgi:hypothetical protein
MDANDTNSASGTVCPKCRGPLTATKSPVWPLECNACKVMLRGEHRRGVLGEEGRVVTREEELAERIVLLERRPGAYLVDVQEWCLEAMRNELALRTRVAATGMALEDLARTLAHEVLGRR